MLLKNIIVIENFTCNIVFSEANLSLGLVNILQNYMYIAEMVRWHLKTWITDYKRVQENFHSLKKKKTQNESICRLSSNTSITWDFRIKEKEK